MNNTTVAVLDPKEFGVEPQIAEGFVKGLNIVRQERELLIEEFNRVSKLEITPETIKEYRALRLKVQKNRTQGTAKWHKNMKEIPLRQGKLIDAIRNNEDSINLNMESVLMNGEKAYEILKKEKQFKIQAGRVSQIKDYIEDADQRDFTKFEEDEFEAFLAMKKKAYEDAIAEAKKVEAERLAKEKAEAEEREKQRLENIRLKKEAEAKEKELAKERAEALKKQQEIEAKAKKEREAHDKLMNERAEILRPYIKYIRDYNKMINLPKVEFEKELSEVDKGAKAHLKYEAEQLEKKRKEEEDKEQQLAKERAKNEAILKKEREAKSKLEAELKAKQDAEAKEIAERNAKILADKQEAEKLSKAPVKERLTLWVDSFRLPQTTDFNNETAQDITAKFKAFKNWAKIQVNNI